MSGKLLNFFNNMIRKTQATKVEEVNKSPFLQLRLKKIENVVGIYDPNNSLPTRMRWLHPDAAESFNKISPFLVVSDMLRTAESSLAAVKAKRGAKPPAFSAHNYGLAIDIDIKKSMKLFGAKTKKELDGLMANAGWFCHRTDHAVDFEAWHYNFLGIGTVIGSNFKNTSGYIEERIKELYGNSFVLDPKTVQLCLQKLKFYNGEIDGALGPQSKQAIAAFQRAWGISNATGKADATTQRILAFIACDRIEQ